MNWRSVENELPEVTKAVDNYKESKDLLVMFENGDFLVVRYQTANHDEPNEAELWSEWCCHDEPIIEPKYWTYITEPDNEEDLKEAKEWLVGVRTSFVEVLVSNKFAKIGDSIVTTYKETSTIKAITKDSQGRTCYWFVDECGDKVYLDHVDKNRE